MGKKMKQQGPNRMEKSVVSNKRLPYAAWASTMAKLDNHLAKEIEDEKKANAGKIEKRDEMGGSEL